jgi:hypothetical protein
VLLDWPSTISNVTSSSVTTTLDRDAHQAQHHSMSIATLRTKARLKPKRNTTRTTTRGLSSNTTAPSRQLCSSHQPGPHTAVEVGSCFMGEWRSLPFFSFFVFSTVGMRNFGGSLLHFAVREVLWSGHFPAWEGCRSAAGTHRSCVAVSRLMNARTSPRPSLRHSAYCAGVLSGLSALALRVLCGMLCGLLFFIRSSQISLEF